MRPLVKICGLTRAEDALLAERRGADALGFIFYRPSPRYAAPETVRGIVARLHPFTATVGVFVGAAAAEINAICTHCRLDRVQLHGGEPYSLLAELERPGYRVMRPKDEASLAALRRLPDETIMLDTYDPGLFGGTGKSSNWEWSRSLGEGRQIILAGGLGPENILAAIAAARPSAVDFSSGLEASPGIKDSAKIEALFEILSTQLGQPEATGFPPVARQA